MQSFKKGDVVQCISLEGFRRDSQNYLIKAGVQLGEKYTVTFIGDYIGTGLLGINLEGKNHMHPASSFKLVTDEIINSYEIY